MEFGLEFVFAKTLNPTDFGDFLILHLVPPAGRLWDEMGLILFKFVLLFTGPRAVTS